LLYIVNESVQMNNVFFFQFKILRVMLESIRGLFS
jgi:hypothetical protein